MACSTGLDGCDCAADHWSPLVGGRREGANWRAPCPVCQSPRALEYDTPGKHVRWRSFCGRHDKEAVRPALAALIGACMPGGRPSISADDITALALSDLPPTALRVALLEMAGMSVTDALAKLGVDRTSRYRIRTQLSQFCDKPAGRRLAMLSQFCDNRLSNYCDNTAGKSGVEFA